MNILLITCDQFRPDAIENASPGQPLASPLADHIRTPNLAKLAREGTRFTECHSPDPICVPARASITTGLYPHQATGRKNVASAHGSGVLSGSRSAQFWLTELRHVSMASPIA